ncbi:ELWxxDGT repeat-containing protein [Soonwooa buanensis]|uniref:ELWxxDGT repeat-containing protein n=1 Tax=Soonwooa buanensis TaxID=619805 RepID=A0A1T5FR84_9FLAO|nr:T9SS type A sorting domain-containing protein [Soonwooa buanensis]SKB98698.1 ELWxxDGT repeat-containing protein [Soonwooa buanensis]
MLKKIIYFFAVSIFGLLIKGQERLDVQLQVNDYATGSIIRTPVNYKGDLYFELYRFTNNSKYNFAKYDVNQNIAKFLAKDIVIKSKIIEHKGFLYFVGSNLEQIKNQLWRSDGTEEGTKIVRQIYNSSSNNDNVTLFAVGDMMYIDIISSLWVSDGTFDNTKLLKNLSYYQEYNHSNNKVLSIENTYDGDFVNVTDGTVAGTKTIAEFDKFGVTLPRGKTEFLKFNNELFFTAKKNGVVSIWKTDGNTVTKIVDNENFGNLQGTSFEDDFFFVDSKNNLWRSKGTDNSTNIFAHLATDEKIQSFTVFDNNLYIDTNLDIYKIQKESTNLEKANLTDKDSSVDIANVTSNKTYLILTLTEGYTKTSYISDGKKANNRLIKFAVNYDESQNTYIEINNKLYYSGSNAVNGAELFNYDLQQNKEDLAIDLSFGYRENYVNSIKIGEKFFYNTGNILSVRDINSGQTTQLLNTGYSNINLYTYMDAIASGSFYYSYNQEINGKIVRSNGTIENSNIISQSFGKITDFFNFNDTAIIFIALDSQGTQRVVKLDNNSSVFEILLEKQITGVTGEDKMSNHIVKDGILYFVFRDDDGLWKLWKTDGTTQNTTKVNAENSFVFNELRILGLINNKIIYTGYNSEYPGKSTLLTLSLDTNTVENLSIYNFKIYNKTYIENNTMFFLGAGISEGYLYKTDGTKTGTTMVKYLGVNNYSYPKTDRIFKCGNELYLNFGTSLWKSNATNAGTIKIADKIIQNTPVCLQNNVFALRGDDITPGLIRYKENIITKYNFNVTSRNTQLIEEYQIYDNAYLVNLHTDGRTLYFFAPNNILDYKQYIVTDQKILNLNILDFQNNTNKLNTIQAFPNPTSNYINLRSLNSDIPLSRIEIYSMTGAKLINTKASNDIFVGNLPLGTYLIKAYYDDGNFQTTKFIKK